MGDILTQDEIDALLMATAYPELTALRDWLKKRKGLEGKEIAGFLRQLEGACKADPSPDRDGVVVNRLVSDTPLCAALGEAEVGQLRGLLAQARVGWRQHPRTAAPQSPGPPERIVSRYDFRHPARVNKDQLRTLENLHDNFARLLSSTFSGAMRAVVDVDTAFVDQTTYAEFIRSLSNPSCSYQFTLGPTNGQAILDFAMPVAFAFVDRIFGGKGSSKGVEARQLSVIEMGVLARIVKRAIADLEATWEPILRVEISDIELETNPEFMQITAASEIVILLAFEVNTANASGLVSLCYPFFTLESILPRLGQRTYVRQGRPNREEVMLQNQRRLAGARLPLSAEMARGQLTVEALRSTRVGDVMVTQTRHTSPCVLYVGDKPKYYARPFTRDDGSIGLQVVGRVPPARYRDYIED